MNVRTGWQPGPINTAHMITDTQSLVETLLRRSSRTAASIMFGNPVRLITSITNGR